MENPVKRSRLFAPLAIGAMILAACTPAASQSSGPVGSGEKLGGTISILAIWTGAEEETFKKVIQPWVDANGVDVQYEGTRDLSTVLTTKVEGNDPPDVAGLPNPGAMAEFAKNGDLIPLEDFMDIDQLNTDYNEGWIADGTVDGKLVGIWAKGGVKGLVWYNPKAFTAGGYEVPTDWTSFNALVDKIKSDGHTPWGIGLEGGADSGWPGTDWIEDLVLRQAGPEVYDKWWQGTQKWTSPEIKKAFQAFGKWAADPAYVFGGPNNELSTAFGNGGDCLFTDPPGCYLHHQASFISGNFVENNPDTAIAGETFDFFPMPADKFKGATTAGDLFGMFKDTPQARSLMKYLTTEAAQELWVGLGGNISANRSVPLTAYTDPTAKKIAEALNAAEVVRYDAGDKMPAQMGRAFFGAMLDYVQNPDNLDKILEDLDKVQAEAYAQ
jgi:alpha-glucoside transport system substrate-binding protein